MEFEVVFKTILYLSFVLGAVYLLLKVVQKYSKFGSWSTKSGKESGIKIDNVLYIDEGTKIISLSNSNGSNYVIAMGKQHSLLIDKYKTGKIDETKG